MSETDPRACACGGPKTPRARRCRSCHRAGKVAAPPGAPRDLSAEVLELWRGARAQLERQGTWQESDLPCLERYVRAVERAAEARRTAEAEPLVVGSTGQPVAHPMFQVARQAELDAHKYATALLLTPEARAKHGIEPDDGPDDELDGLL